MSNNLEMALATNNQYILSLPPIHESALLYLKKTKSKVLWLKNWDYSKIHLIF